MRSMIRRPRLVTRDFLRAELAQVREEIATLRGELRILHCPAWKVG